MLVDALGSTCILATINLLKSIKIYNNLLCIIVTSNKLMSKNVTTKVSAIVLGVSSYAWIVLSSSTKHFYQLSSTMIKIYLIF